MTVYRLDALCPFCAEGERINGCDVPPETAGEMIASLAEADGINVSPAMRREMGYAFITSKYAYAWKTQSGEIASIAKISDEPVPYIDIHTVFTREQFRGHGYAKALLTEICQEILDGGQIPMLYADSGYESSNTAYRAIGFVPSARLTAFRLKHYERKGGI